MGLYRKFNMKYLYVVCLCFISTCAMAQQVDVAGEMWANLLKEANTRVVALAVENNKLKTELTATKAAQDKAAQDHKDEPSKN